MGVSQYLFLLTAQAQAPFSQLANRFFTNSNTLLRDSMRRNIHERETRQAELGLNCKFVKVIWVIGWQKLKMDQVIAGSQ